MGKTFLTEKELRQFPSIRKLTELCGLSNPHDWGLCQNDAGQVVFKEWEYDWLLQVPLEEIYAVVHYQYGEYYNPDDIIIIYGVECGGTNDIYFDIIEITDYEELKKFTPFEWVHIIN